MANNNGFVEVLEQMNRLIDVDQRVTLEALEEAASYFVNKLMPKIPKSIKNKKHLKDTLKIIVVNDMIQVIFDDESFYWHLVEHGHKSSTGRRVKGRHFVRNTIDAESEKISQIMLEKISKKIGG